MSQTGSGQTGSPESTRRIGFVDGTALTDRAPLKESKIQSSLLLFLLEAESRSRKPVHSPFTAPRRRWCAPDPGRNRGPELNDS
jgi:hypothetical protein